MTPIRKHFRLEDVSLAPYIFGLNDKHLSIITKAFDVRIYARGESVVIEAESPSSTDTALAFLALLYDEIERKPRHVSSETFQGLINKAKAETPTEHAVPAVTIHTPGRTISAFSAAQQAYIEAIRSHDMVFSTGPAGTGKTFLAVGCAVEQLLSHQFDRIILCRPAVEAGEKIGFLPGDIHDKVDPYMQPLYDALRETLSAETLERMMEKKTVEIAPLAFMRGRTLKRAFIILDEAQNATHTQMRMFLTRLGEGSKMVICGDVSQIDLPGNNLSGLMRAVHLTRDIDDVAYAPFTGKDVMRHSLVRQVVEAYAAYDAKRMVKHHEEPSE